MAAPELGTKRTCPVTGRKFYDLGKDPIVSPYTGQSYPRSAFEPTGRAAAAKPAPDEEEEEEAEADAAAPETVSLDEAATEETVKDAPVEDIEVEDDAETDDAFLEEEEESDDDVADLIDGDIEPDEET